MPLEKLYCMLATLLLPLGFQTSVMALATLWGTGTKGEKKMAVGFKESQWLLLFLFFRLIMLFIYF